MSGGHLEISHRHLQSLAEQLDEIVSRQWECRLDKSDLQDGEVDRGFEIKTLLRIQNTIEFLQKASQMVKRIDYLLASDDSEKSFNEQWDEEKLDDYRLSYVQNKRSFISKYL